MFTIEMTRLHEIMIVLYAFSILLYFLDFLHQNQKANRFAFWSLSIVWLLQTIFFCSYMYHTGHFPVLTLFEGLYFYAWILLTLSLVMNRFLRIDFTVFFTNVIGFLIMTIHTFAPEQTATREVGNKMISELLLIHITMAIGSYVLFSFSFVLYLLQYKWLKEKKWSHRLWRLQDLNKLEKISTIVNAIGVPILLLSLILGLQWAYLKLANVHWFDPKIIGSFIVFIEYSAILYLQERKYIFGRTLAYWNVGAFLFIFVNFFLVSRFSQFHLYF